jgi:hypothetical protein
MEKKPKQQGLREVVEPARQKDKSPASAGDGGRLEG